MIMPGASDPREGTMRIMVVTDQYEPMVGGVPTVTRELAHGLAERGHSVAMVVPSPGWRGRRTTAGRVSVTFRGSLRWPWYEDMRLGCLPASAARKLISSFAPDVAHIHSPVTLGVMARIGASRRRVPVVYTNHYLPDNVRPSTAPRSRVLDAVFYRHVVGFSNRCSYVTAPTTTALGLLREHGLRVPSGVISNGVDLRTYSPGPADDQIRQCYRLPADRPLIAASYDSGPIPVTYVEPFAAGDVLPEMPLFLETGSYVPAPLEATYQTAWGHFPAAIRDRL